VVVGIDEDEVALGAHADKAIAAITAPPPTRNSLLETSFFSLFSALFLAIS
jgi:hypothetical protein